MLIKWQLLSGNIQDYNFRGLQCFAVFSSADHPPVTAESLIGSPNMFDLAVY